MKSKFRFLISSFIILLTLGTSQLVEASQQDSDSLTHFVGSPRPVIPVTEQELKESDNKNYGPIGPLSTKLITRVLRKAAYQQALDRHPPMNIALVCQKWNTVVRHEIEIEAKKPRSPYGSYCRV